MFRLAIRTILAGIAVGGLIAPALSQELPAYGSMTSRGATTIVYETVMQSGLRQRGAPCRAVYESISECIIAGDRAYCTSYGYWIATRRERWHRHGWLDSGKEYRSSLPPPKVADVPDRAPWAHGFVPPWVPFGRP